MYYYFSPIIEIAIWVVLFVTGISGLFLFDGIRKMDRKKVNICAWVLVLTLCVAAGFMYYVYKETMT